MHHEELTKESFSNENSQDMSGKRFWSLCEKCRHEEFLLVRIFPYSVPIGENTGQKNSVFGQFHTVVI